MFHGVPQYLRTIIKSRIFGTPWNIKAAAGMQSPAPAGNPLMQTAILPWSTGSGGICPCQN
jgi:hypothetical protein